MPRRRTPSKKAQDAAEARVLAATPRKGGQAGKQASCTASHPLAEASEAVTEAVTTSATAEVAGMAAPELETKAAMQPAAADDELPSAVMDQPVSALHGSATLEVAMESAELATIESAELASMMQATRLKQLATEQLRVRVAAEMEATMDVGIRPNTALAGALGVQMPAHMSVPITLPPLPLPPPAAVELSGPEDVDELGLPPLAALTPKPSAALDTGVNQKLARKRRLVEVLRAAATIPDGLNQPKEVAQILGWPKPKDVSNVLRAQYLTLDAEEAELKKMEEKREQAEMKRYARAARAEAARAIELQAALTADLAAVAGACIQPHPRPCSVCLNPSRHSL